MSRRILAVTALVLSAAAFSSSHADGGLRACVVTGVSPDDVLNVRHAPGASATKTGAIAANATDVKMLGPVVRVGRTDWFEIRHEGITGWASSRYLACRQSATEAKAWIGGRASAVVAALAERDMDRLAEYVHPTRGVRFSPQAFVQPDQDVKLSAAELRTAFEDRRPRVWGYADGTGETIYIPFAEYFKRYVYNRDYAGVTSIGYNLRIGVGNSIDNTLEIYRSAAVVEFFSPGEDTEGMSWSSLRVVFADHDGVPHVVALIHDQWTI